MTADRGSQGSPLHSESQKESWADGRRLAHQGQGSSADGRRLAHQGPWSSADSQPAVQRPGSSADSQPAAHDGRYRAKLCLKARPTPVQLADRLRPVDGLWPEGVELYLAAADLSAPARVATIVEGVLGAEVPDDFVWLIEGPVDSLDGGDFDITRQSEADQVVIERL